jgi:hypothetical protein
VSAACAIEQVPSGLAISVQQALFQPSADFLIEPQRRHRLVSRRHAKA